eukprot:Clim_evm16s235 gene=Clim_evmTU16s235
MAVYSKYYQMNEAKLAMLAAYLSHSRHLEMAMKTPPLRIVPSKAKSKVKSKPKHGGKDSAADSPSEGTRIPLAHAVREFERRVSEEVRKDAIKHQNINSMVLLARMYHNGYGRCDRNRPLSKRWLGAASNRGSMMAGLLLDLSHQMGR